MILAYSKKQTKNLGNYENISVEISLEDEVDLMAESREECLDRLRNFVNTQIQEELSVLSKGKGR